MFSNVCKLSVGREDIDAHLKEWTKCGTLALYITTSGSM